MDAKLIINPESIQNIKVRVVLDLSLEQVADLADDLAALRARASVDREIPFHWQTGELSHRLNGLRSQAEEMIEGLKFEAKPE